jgi:hypothetical protein
MAAQDHLPLCEVCLRPLSGDDLEDGVTAPADCCERCGLCAECREPGNHDCEEGRG